MGQTAALPEPPTARKKRLWGVWLDWALKRADRLCLGAISLYFFLTVPLILMMIFGGKAVDRQVEGIMFAKLGLAVLLVLFSILVIAPITFIRWWLRADAGTRRSRAWTWAVEHSPTGVFMMVMVTSPAIERAITGRSNLMVGTAVTVVALALAAACLVCLVRWRARSP
jgi:hypothetical protein